jgi:hypothetical protein
VRALSWLRAGIAPSEDILGHVEMGLIGTGGWSAHWESDVASIDATCFRLRELDDLGGLTRTPARRSIDWLGQPAAPRRHLGRGRQAGVLGGPGLGQARRSRGPLLPDRERRVLARRCGGRRR